MSEAPADSFSRACKELNPLFEEVPFKPCSDGAFRYEPGELGPEVWRGFDDGPPPPAKEAELLAFFANPAEVSPETLKEPVTAGGGEWRVDMHGRSFLATRADCRYIDGITTIHEYRMERAEEHAAWKEAEARKEHARAEAQRLAKAERAKARKAAPTLARLLEATEHIDEVMLATSSMLRPVPPDAVAASVARSRARRKARRRMARPA